MKAFRTFSIIVFLSALSACAPTYTAGNAAAYYDLEIYPVTPSKATVYVTKPAAFPEPSIVYNLGFDCFAQDGIQQNSAEGKAELKSFKAFAATNPSVDISPKRIRVQTFLLYCENNRVVYKAPNLYELFAFISDGGSMDTFGASGNSLEFVVSSGYRYPNLRIDYYSFSTHVLFDRAAVSATNEYGAVVPITLVQNGTPQPVVFEGQHFRASFDPAQKFSVVVKRRAWEVLEFDYSQGTLTWNQAGRRPY